MTQKLVKTAKPINTIKHSKKKLSMKYLAESVLNLILEIYGKVYVYVYIVGNPKL